MVPLKLRQTLNGPLMYLPHDTYIGRSLDLYGEFSALEGEFFNFVARGGAAIDVGANIGAHSVGMANKYGHVFAFEPQEVLYRILKANLALHHNVTTYHAGVGNEEGILWLAPLDYGVQNNFGALSRDLEVSKDIEMVKVQLRQLDKVEGIQREDKIDLIKIDVEGMEKEVLEGAVATIDKHKPILYVENDKPTKSEALVRVIYNLGYKAWWHIAPLFRPNNFDGRQEDVFPGICSFNLICIPDKHWLTLQGCLECTPDKPGLPEGCIA